MQPHCPGFLVALFIGFLSDSFVRECHGFDPQISVLHLSLTIGAESRRVQVSWTGGLQPEPGDRIFLLAHIPEYHTENENANEKPLFEIQPDAGEGWVETDIPYEPSAAVNVSGCYAPWAVYVTDGGRAIATACLATRPTWMHDMRQLIGRRRLGELFIPGTHDSGSCSDGKRNTYVTKYTVTQDESITSQLEHGIRYLDIRVGYYRATRSWPLSVINRLRNGNGDAQHEEFWVNHGPAKMQPLVNVLKEISDFADRTNEIVIVDVQEFPVGFENDDMTSHAALLEVLVRYLGKHLTPPSLTWAASLNEIWNSRRRVIIAYDHERTVRSIGKDIVWKAVEQHWGNVKDVAALKAHLSQSASLRLNPIAHNFRPVASMAELTPDIWDILSDRFKGLRRMADSVNRHITKWYYEELGHTANIVALDFFRGTDIVEIALAWNIEKNKVT